ncbi:MAG TPA: long-chain fatty acid--CoA ligase [Chitinophagaceae bacterium]|nr:long-chain fatty acid--CoA ligase [Chitinophagaceae bacterium]
MENKRTDFSSLHGFLQHAAEQLHHHDREFLFHKPGKEYKGITFKETLHTIDVIAAYLLHLGLHKGDRCAIILENCPQYVFFDQALMKLGLVNVSIYPTLTADETKYILDDSGAKTLLVGTPFLVKKYQKIATFLPNIQKVITLFDEAPEGSIYANFQTMLQEGEQQLPTYQSKINEAYQQVSSTDLATLIYTSGTTGIPKGVMLTHGNFMSNCYDGKILVPAIEKSDKFLSILPLSHVYERMIYYLSTYIGAQIAYSESIERIIQNLGEAQPTIMACVPRLLERVEERVRRNAIEQGGWKYKIFLWALKIGESHRLAIEQGRRPGIMTSLQYSLAEKLVYSKIKARMGGRIKLMVSGGGALAKFVGEFFGNIGIKVQEGYGLTETSPFITVNEFHRQVFGTTGRVGPSQQVAIQNYETMEILTVQTYDSFDPKFESGEGEILVKGPNIMQGYYNKPDETNEVIDADGWFHTGDIGKFEDGYLKITDRLKNMLKTSLGKNIFPTPIENTYLKSDIIEQVFLIGDKQEFVTGIVVPNKDELMKQFQLDETFFQEADPFIQNKDIIDWIEADLKKFGASLAKFEQMRNVLVKRNPFTLEDGEVTPTQKIKRKVVIEKYQHQIKGLYA